MKKILLFALMFFLFIPYASANLLDDFQDVYDDLDDIDWDELGYVATSDYSQYEFVGLYDSESGNLVMLPNMGATKYYNAQDWINAKATGYNEAVSHYWHEIDEILPDLEEAIDDLEDLPTYEEGYAAGWEVGTGEGATIDDFRCDLIQIN